jgi:hypothetical protein
VFQLILGISLGLLLLFVVLLLVTEVAATYQVLKHFDRNDSPPDSMLPRQGIARQNHSKILLLLLSGVAILSVLIYLLIEKTNLQAATPGVKAEQAAPSVQSKLLSALSSDHTISFRLQTKWQDGKMYGNNSVFFHTDSIRPLTGCRYFLLDKDGFLVKQVLFSTNDFVYETGPDGRVRGLMSKFNTDLSPEDYQKIEKLQVVLDNQIQDVEQTNRRTEPQNR